MLYLGKVLDVFYGLFQIGYPVDQNGELGIQGYLSIDVSLSVHEATVWVG